MPSKAKPTIKEFAHDYFLRVNYVDIYGRNVGYDYDHILAEIKKQFPKSKTSRRWLRIMAYELNGSARMPVRRRSRRALAEGYAEVLLLRRSGGSVHRHVTEAVKKKFPDQHISAPELRRLEGHLRFLKFAIPPRC